MDLKNSTKLNNANYEAWKLRTEALLIRESLWTHVKNDPPVAGEGQAQAAATAKWVEGDEKARATILLLLEENQFGVIRATKTAKEAWAALAKHHQKATLSTRVSLLQRMCETRYTEGEDMDDYLTKMEDLYTKLCSAGKDLGEDTMVAFILRGLPKSFNALTTALETRADDALTLNLIREKLLDEVSKQNRNSSGGSALKAAGRKPIVCHFCKQPGHKQRDCKLQKEQKGPKKQNARTARDGGCGNMYALTIGNGDTVNDWIIDSGASSHMTSNREFFEALEPASGEVELADGRVVAVVGTGTGVIECVDGSGSTNKIRLHNVMYVPKLSASLLSVLAMTNRKAKIEFVDGKCKIVVNGNEIAVATKSKGLYRLNKPEYGIVSKVTASHKRDCQHTWHRRFGHREPDALQVLLRKKLVTGMTVADCGIREGCECCVKGKQARTPFPKTTEKKTSAPLDLIHSDVYGPLETPSKKSEVAERIEEFCNYVHTQFGKYPKRIRSDRGGEYSSEALMEFYRKHGIHPEFTAGYSPQQNGVAERRNRYLIEMCRCMLMDAKMPSRFWAEATSTAVYLQNHLPSRAVETTPYELWWGRKPNVSHLKVFGCRAFVHVPKEKRSKLQDKAVEMTFVGYSNNHKAYRFIDVDTNKLVISRDVRFFEEELVQPGTDVPNLEEESYEDILHPLSPIPAASHEVPNTSDPEDTDEEDEDPDGTDTEFDSCDESGHEDLEATIVRRSERSNKGVAPQRYREASNMVQAAEPKTYEEALSGPESTSWKAAMEEEMKSLRENSTWTVGALPEGRKAVGCKWLYKRKLDENGRVTRYKARLVAQGFSQKFGTDYDQVFAPVAKQVTFRTLLTIATRRQLLVKHVDIKTAYLYGTLTEEVYMRQPRGYETGASGEVCHLKKTLYGLKQSGRIWNQTIDDCFKKLCFVKSTVDACLYVRTTGSKQVFIVLYVDDMLIVCETEAEYDAILGALSKQFKTTSLGDVRQYLGIQVERANDGRFLLTQQCYIQRLASRFGLEMAKPSLIPMDPGYLQAKEEESSKLPNNISYSSLVGGLLYIAVNTRPDVAISVSLLGRKVSAPTAADWTEAKRTMRYLLATKHFRLNLGSNNVDLKAFVDADWAGDHRDRKSNSGFIISFGGGAISWAARKQTCVALSSTEAEFIAAAEVSQELLWILKLMKDVHEPESKILLYEDNQSTIRQLESEQLQRRSKHVDTKFQFTKDLVQQGVLTVVYCPSEHMVADMLTKPLNKIKLLKHRTTAGVLPGRFEEEC